MDLRDYVEMQGRAVGGLGDATEDLQAIVDAGLRIPSGFYHLKGRVRLHGPHPGRRESDPSSGVSSFTHVEPVRLACRTCGAACEWLAPFGMASAMMWCRRCEAYSAHDQVDGSGSPRSAQEIWEASRAIEGSYGEAPEQAPAG